MAHREVIGHYNVLRKNSKTTVQNDIEDLAKRASAFDLNEGNQVKAIREVLADLGYHWDRVEGGSDWLCWDPQAWSERPWHKVWKVSKSAHEMGFDFKVNPARFLIARALVHRPSGERFDLYATHLAAGYAKPEGTFPDRLERLKDLQAKQGVHNVERITSSRIRARKAVAFHILNGDMNSRQDNRDEPWYPANVWRDTWRPDSRPGSIDWMMISRKASQHGLRVEKRYALGDKPGQAGFDSDHSANFMELRF